MAELCSVRCVQNNADATSSRASLAPKPVAHHYQPISGCCSLGPTARTSEIGPAATKVSARAIRQAALGPLFSPNPSCSPSTQAPPSMSTLGISLPRSLATLSGLLQCSQENCGGQLGLFPLLSGPRGGKASGWHRGAPAATGGACYQGRRGPGGTACGKRRLASNSRIRPGGSKGLGLGQNPGWLEEGAVGARVCQCVPVARSSPRLP